MIVSITNPIIQTYFFSALLIIALILSLRKKTDTSFFGVSVSQELKGLAILSIILAHVTYALVSDTNFLRPLSGMAGVGVNLFLILSGYGLMFSSLSKPLSLSQFYKRRLLNLFIPFWVCLSLFFFIDYFWLNLNYGLVYMAKSFLGIFTHADLYQDVNSPFWYFTLIVIYYLLFPLFFIRKKPWLSAILMYLIPLALISFKPTFLDYVIHLYRIHLIAFPLGMLLAWFFKETNVWLKIKLFLDKLSKWRLIFVALLLAAIFYFSKNSGVGEAPIIEELLSVISSLLIIALFVIKKIDIKALYWFGFFSYEIYMLHWPLMYRYDFLFKYLPAWLAMFLYLIVFVIFAYLLQTTLNLKWLSLKNNNK